MISDRLAHVFVGVHDDAQVHAINRDYLAVDADLALIIARLQLGAGGGHRLMIQLDPHDNQARVDRARAALAVAEARAASLKITVPFTVGTTTSATSAAEAQLAAGRAELSRATTTYDRLSETVKAMDPSLPRLFLPERLSHNADRHRRRRQSTPDQHPRRTRSQCVFGSS